MMWKAGLGRLDSNWVGKSVKISPPQAQMMFRGSLPYETCKNEKKTSQAALGQLVSPL